MTFVVSYCNDIFNYISSLPDLILTIFLLYQISSHSPQYSWHYAQRWSQTQDHDCVYENWKSREKRETKGNEMGKDNVFQKYNFDFQSFIQCGSLLSETHGWKLNHPFGLRSFNLNEVNANVSFPNTFAQRVKTRGILKSQTRWAYPWEVHIGTWQHHVLCDSMYALETEHRA